MSKKTKKKIKKANLLFRLNQENDTVRIILNVMPF